MSSSDLYGSKSHSLVPHFKLRAAYHMSLLKKFPTATFTAASKRESESVIRRTRRTHITKYKLVKRERMSTHIQMMHSPRVG